MTTELILLGVCILLVYSYAFVSGFTDAANAIATSVCTRALSPKVAVIMAGVLEIVGALSGTAVALMIGKGIVDPSRVSLTTVAGALLGVMTWSLITYWRGIPVSETHGLIGAVIGAALVTTLDPATIQWESLSKVLAAIIISPLCGFLLATGAYKAIYFLCANLSARKMSLLFKNLQRLSAAFMAYSHGRNDAQKPMGMLVMVLAIFFGWNLNETAVPLWVILSIGTTAGLGVAAGGWRVIKTLGMKMTPLRVEQGFAAEASAAGVLQVASSFGIPVSTTHTITSAIIGVGVARNVASVHWALVTEIALSWVLTLPATIAFGAICAWLLSVNIAFLAVVIGANLIIFGIATRKLSWRLVMRKTVPPQTHTTG